MVWLLIPATVTRLFLVIDDLVTRLFSRCRLVRTTIPGARNVNIKMHQSQVRMDVEQLSLDKFTEHLGTLAVRSPSHNSYHFG